MKRSVCIQLLVTASLLGPVAGCSERGAAGGAAVPDWGAQVADDGFDPNQAYPANTYFPRLGYYHPGARWFYPYPVNFYGGARGYYSAGAWLPAPAVLAASNRPDPARAFAYLAAHRRRARGAFGGSYAGGGGHYFGGGSWGEGGGEAHGVSRGGFGGFGHFSGGA